MWRFFVKIHEKAARIVLGKKLVEKHEALRVKSAETDERLEKRVRAIEDQTCELAKDCGLVANGNGAH